MQTLLLDRGGWDLLVDAFGNIAVASDPYSQSQDAASAIRLFSGECYYDTTRGVPYWNKNSPAAPGQILGKAPPLSYVREKLIAAALTVPGVTAARVFFLKLTLREMTGQVQITNNTGQPAAASF